MIEYDFGKKLSGVVVSNANFRGVFSPEFIKSLDVFKGVQLNNNLFGIVSKNPFKSYGECNVHYHPLFVNLFGDDFSVNDIQSRWLDIAQYLKDHFPINFFDDCDGVKDRFFQLIDCQTAGFILPVCRSAYPEVEALLRDHILMKDPDFRQSFEDKRDAQARRTFQGQKLKALILNDTAALNLFGWDELIHDIGVHLVFFRDELEKIFDHFDPLQVGENADVSLRHLHAHGYVKRVGFIDGVNALLALDLTIRLVCRRSSKTTGALAG